MSVLSGTTSNFQLPQDRNSETLQLLAPVGSASVNGTVAATSARVTLPASYDVLLFTNTVDMWVKFGTGSVAITTGGEASSFLLLAGERPFQKPVGMTHMAFIRIGSNDGIVCVTPLN